MDRLFLKSNVLLENNIVKFEFSDNTVVFLDKRVKSNTYNKLFSNNPTDLVKEEIIVLPKKYRDLMVGPNYHS